MSVAGPVFRRLSPFFGGLRSRAGAGPVCLIEFLRFSVGVAILLVAAGYGALHWSVLQIPHPITQDEPGFVEITAAPNPYAWENLKVCGNVYGPGYAAFARPFTLLSANPYIAHRWASTAALGLTLFLLGWQLRREAVSRLATAGALVIVYALNVSSHSLAASSDLLASALCFGALVAGRQGTWPALLVCVLLSALASLTKLYAVFGWLVVATHLLVFAPRSKFFAFVGLSAAIAMIVAVLLRRYAPGYFLSTLVVQWVATTSSFTALRNQTAEFLLLTAGLAILALWGWPRRRTFSWASGRPWFSPPIDLWFWAALWAGVLLLGRLGWHPGNYLVYYYHLLLLPLAIVAARRINRERKAGLVLLLLNLLVLGWQFPPLPGRDYQEVLEWNLSQVNGPVLAEPLFEPFRATHPQLELFEHGQTASILQALDSLGAATPAAYLALHRELLDAAEAKIARIRSQEFAAIYISYQHYPGQAVWTYDRERYNPALSAHYQPVGEIVIYPYCTPFWDRMQHGRYAFHLMKWIPKPAAKAADQTSPPGSPARR